MATTKRSLKSQPDDTFRGVWRIDRPGRPNPFGVQWREKIWDEKTGKEKSKRATEFFAKAEDREKRYAAVAADKALGKPSTASREDLRQWAAFMTAAKGVPWQEILSGYHNNLKMTGVKPCSETIASFGKKYLAECAAKMARREMSIDAERHNRRAVSELTARLGHMALDFPTADVVEKAIDAMGNKSPATFNSYRKYYLTFFNRAVALKLIRENPINGLNARRHQVDNSKRILSPQDMAKLFAFALDHSVFKKILGRLALEAFMGARFSSGYRFSKEDINFQERGIKLPAEKLKEGMESGVSHYVDTNNFPGLEILWEWLAVTPDECWRLLPRQYLELKSQVFVAAGVPHPKNCLRKSFATYDLAAHRNPGRTAYILAHVDEKELWNDYKANATTADGRLYQTISPATCREIAAGVQPQGPNQPHTIPTRRGESSWGASPARAV